MRRGLFMGYHWHSGLKWSGDYLVVDAETYARYGDGRHCHVMRTKEIEVPDKPSFPVYEGRLRFDDPVAEQRTRAEASRPLGEDNLGTCSLDFKLGYPEELPAAADEAEAEVQQLVHEPDFWEKRGDTVVRVHREPRTQLFIPTDAADPPPVPVAALRLPPRRRQREALLGSST